MACQGVSVGQGMATIAAVRLQWFAEGSLQFSAAMPDLSAIEQGGICQTLGRPDGTGQLNPYWLSFCRTVGE